MKSKIKLNNLKEDLFTNEEMKSIVGGSGLSPCEDAGYMYECSATAGGGGKCKFIHSIGIWCYDLFRDPPEIYIPQG